MDNEKMLMWLTLLTTIMLGTVIGLSILATDDYATYKSQADEQLFR